VKKHYYAGATRLAVRIADGTLYYLLTDHLGSSNVTASTSGDLTTELRYYPFGLDRYDAGSQKTAYRFTGQRIEETLDLYYYGARWYDPVVGRFLQPDTTVPNPGNPQSLNRYTYVYNNPLRYQDPTGHFAWIPIGAAGGAVGGAIYGYYLEVSENLSQGKNLGQALTTNIDPGKILFWTGTGALLGSGVGVVGAGAAALLGTTGAGTTVATAATTAVTAASADGDPTNEMRTALESATSVGARAVQAVTDASKIASQLQSKAGILQIKVAGNMGSLSNPEVQKGLARINSISTNADRIWSGTWKGMQVYEYVKDGIGVVRDRVTGELITVLERTDLSKLDAFVQSGIAEWLK